MKELIFATHNQHKVTEVAKLLNDKYQILSLTDIGCDEDIPETGNTFAENAFIKANYVFQKYNLPCFADDSGLEVQALGGEPGIYSARYAGTGISADNIQLVLLKLEDESNRNANFTTVISFVDGQDNRYFEGKIEGSIRKAVAGEGGFGYDPIFQPDGYTQTFAEIPLELKNTISHRAIAVQKLVEYLASF